MKRFFLYLAAVVCLASCNNKDMLWMAPMVDIDARVTNLEQLCMQMNTNISSMQTIIQALQERDYVTNVAEIKEGNEVIGYTITFAKNPSITIYKGNDGKDGKDGEDGEDGITPQIGVAQDGDVYYWTLNSEWLLDASGNKLRVTGENGKDGQDGEDGQDGADGEDGTDGVTPQFKIENDYWYISYNNGTSWNQLGKAKGDKGDKGATGAAGKDGVDGKDGQDGVDGDSMFKSITEDDTYVYFTFVDDSVIKIAKNKDTAGNVVIENGAIKAAFSVSDTKKVYFSQGNLQYNAALGTHLCADGTTRRGTWRFAYNQWDLISEITKELILDSTYNGWVDKFFYGHSGYNNHLPYKYVQTPIDISNTNYDWGIYNPISNGGNEPNMWRTLSSAEWSYIATNRKNAAQLQFTAVVHDVLGVVILPDDWSDIIIPHSGSAEDRYFYLNTLTDYQWQYYASKGAVFLAGGPSGSTSVGEDRVVKTYYSSSVDCHDYDYWFYHCIGIYTTGIQISTNTVYCERRYTVGPFTSVRLVKDVE